MAFLCTALASSTNDDGGWGLLWIALTVIAIVVVIGAVWAFTARRASRMPDRSRHHHDPGVRGG
jgi:threonine/homoserine/homoserine lactone efflux protein